MRRLAPLLLVLLVAGCGERDDAPKTRITLEGDTAEVAIGERATLAGRVRPRAARVELYAAEGPEFTPERRVATKATNDRGAFRFDVRPERNTAYTIRAGGARSDHVVVYATPRYGYRAKRTVPGRARYEWRARHPEGLVLTHGPVHFYAGADDRYRHVGEAPLEQRSSTLSVASAELASPEGKPQVLACVAKPIAPGYGAPPIKGCGEDGLVVVDE
jgi:hypothetical protein